MRNYQALYHFEGFNRFEIPLQVGDKIKIEEEIKGWYKGNKTLNTTIDN